MPLRFALALLAFALAIPAVAQETPEIETPDTDRTEADETALYDDLVERFRTDALSVTTTVQVIPIVAFEDNPGGRSGWTVPRVWIGIRGRLDGGVGYLVRANLASTPSLLDALVSYGTDDVRAVVGRQMLPFSFEYVTNVDAIDFVRRSRIVGQLNVDREVGASVTARPGGGPLRLQGGLFNSHVSPEPVGGLLAVGRVEGVWGLGQSGRLVLGANALYDRAPDDLSLGTDVRYGADARVELGRFLVGAEVLARESDLDGADVRGGFVTAGVDLTPRDRALARLDVLDESVWVVLGVTHVVTRAALVQAELDLPTDDEPAVALAKFQLAF